ncbi:MAG: Stp1/IreP family PP2C-type Ser/Thr phosphatase [Oscillospiraceae bacterium]|nr:Stp1/IreP family PP2C-type Ser/Thr phosphatase [Oscillospiraceae bacterium]
MKAYGLTDIGKVRESNQDSFAVSVDGALPVWAVVCDGMGGANGGYYASSTTVGIFSNGLDMSFDNLKPKQIENVLVEAVRGANEAVYKTSCEQSDLSGMGTTLVSALVLGDTAYVVHVGDSRAYHINGKKITRVTTDHSVVQQLVDIGQITEEEARVHPEKNMITRAVGVKGDVEPDVTSVKLNKNSAILLCTDGLSNYLEDDEMLEIIQNNAQEDAVDLLVSLALNRGGSDNITAVIIK